MSVMMNTSYAETVDSRWKNLYIMGGAAALISVLLVLLDILISILLPHGEAPPGTRSAVDWFALFQSDRYYALRDLGLLNVVNTLLGIPLYLALFAAHRHANPSIAALGLALALFGAAIYIASNPSLPMLVLSDRYTAATTVDQKAILVAAGEALLAQGADFTPGSLVGLVMPLLAGITIAFVMLREGIFNKATAYTGLAGSALLLVFTVWTILVPRAFGVAMLLAVPGGLLMLAWNVLVARRLLQLAQGTETRRPLPTQSGPAGWKRPV